jgi:signal transduction histidine kinase
VQDVRLLSRSLLPPVLDEQGLAAALTDLADRTAASGFRVDLHVEGLRESEAAEPLDARVAAAAYAIVAEAVVNAGRYSGADGCRVTVELGRPDRPAGPPSDPLLPHADQHQSRAWLAVACEDDGVGVPPDATPGVGTRSIRERAEELGGTVESTPGPGGRGTRVAARLPLAPVEVPA